MQLKQKRKNEERERQRNGETPIESNMSAKFLKGMNLPEVLVRTSKSGSMTQEIFYDYCKHFVSSLKDDHEPVILFLDGHASRWNTQALKYLFDNNVFVFFLRVIHPSGRSQMTVVSTKESTGRSRKPVRSIGEGGAQHPKVISMKFSASTGVFFVRLKSTICLNVLRTMRPVLSSELVCTH